MQFIGYKTLCIEVLSLAKTIMRQESEDAGILSKKKCWKKSVDHAASMEGMDSQRFGLDSSSDRLHTVFDFSPFCSRLPCIHPQNLLSTQTCGDLARQTANTSL